MEVFASLDPETPLIVAEAVWQYSHHLLHGLISHQAPILTVANWSGTWPGLVGMLNLNGSLTKAGVKYSTLWSEDFDDEFFLKGLVAWLKTGVVTHRTAHVHPLAAARCRQGPGRSRQRSPPTSAAGKRSWGCSTRAAWACSTPSSPTTCCSRPASTRSASRSPRSTMAPPRSATTEARAVYEWYLAKGFKFHLGTDEATELTENQVLWQCKTYIAACRIADEFGCETIGIQYQQGLKDLLPASDLVEGTLNSSDRPPVRNARGEIIRAGEPIPHFNEVDECAGLDGLFTNRVHRALGQPVENTLHDLRWGDWDRSGTTDEYVWVFLISGSAPAEHHVGGWAGSDSLRQPPMYFRLGGGTLRGIAKPGEIVWSRVFVENGRLKMDLGRAKVISLPREETERRWKETTVQWPIMHAVTYGVTRDQMMARHKANHIQVAYAHSATEADLALYTKAALAAELGLEVHLCGTKADGDPF